MNNSIVFDTRRESKSHNVLSPLHLPLMLNHSCCCWLSQTDPLTLLVRGPVSKVNTFFYTCRCGFMLGNTGLIQAPGFVCGKPCSLACLCCYLGTGRRVVSVSTWAVGRLYLCLLVSSVLQPVTQKCISACRLERCLYS